MAACIVTTRSHAGTIPAMFKVIRKQAFWMIALTAVAASISLRDAYATTFKNHFVENMIFVRDSANTLSKFGFETFEQDGNALKFNAIKSKVELPHEIEGAVKIEVDFKTEEDALIVAELFSKSNFEVGLSAETTDPLSEHVVFDASQVNFEDVDGMTNGGAYSARLSISEIIEWVKTHKATVGL